MYSEAFKQSAITLRQEGMSLREISSELTISKSTASKWAGDVWLTESAKKILEEKKDKTKLNITLAHISQKLAREKIKTGVNESSILAIKSINYDTSLNKLLCALLYWGEGGKSQSIRFTNSDPTMVSTFLHLLRSSFRIDEKKLRVLIHIHEYHNETELKTYWSQVTQIPMTQFNKTYIKPHTGKRIKAGYMGCAHIYYGNWIIVHELITLYNTYAKSIGV